MAGYDVGAVLRRLIMFDSFTIDAVDFAFVAELVDALGVDVVCELMWEGRLALTLQDWWCGVRRSQWHGPLEFTLSMSGGLHSDRCAAALSKLRERLDLAERSWSRLEEAVLHALTTPLGADALLGSFALYKRAQDAIESDLAHHSGPLEQVVRVVLSHDLDLGEDADLPFRLEWSDDSDALTFDTDIGARYGLSEKDVQDLLHRSLIALTTLNIRLAQAAAFRRMVSLSYRDTSLIAAKYRVLLGDVDPDAMEASFQRVVNIACLPSIDPKASNVAPQTFLRVCRGREADAFRAWLRELPERDDDEIRAEITSTATRVGAALGTPIGESARFAVTTALGFVPVVGGLLGAASGAIDAFWLDELANGAVWFVTNSYGSMITPPPR